MKKLMEWKAGIKKDRVDFSRADVIGTLIIVCIFFSLPVVFFYDSNVYIKYLDFFNGELPWGAWGRSRGWGYPLFLWLSKLLFGESAYGINIMNFIIFFVQLIMMKKVVKCVKGNLHDGLAWIMVFVFLVINPIALGYYHLILTEGLAATVSMCCMGGVLYFQKKIAEGETRFINKAGAAVLVAVCCVYLYAVKQMFFIIPVLMFVLSEVYLSVIKRSKIWVWLAVLGITAVSLTVSIKVWNNFIADKRIADEVIMSETSFAAVDNSSQTFFNVYLIKGATNFEYDAEDKEIIVKNDNEIIDVIPYEEEFNEVKYILKCFTNHPFLLLESYFERYGAMANVYALEKPSKEAAVSSAKVVKEISFIRGFENYSLACWPRNCEYGINTYEELGRIEEMVQYGQYTDDNIVVDVLYSQGVIKIFNFIYTVSILYAPVAMILHFVLIIITRRKENNWYHAAQFTLAGTAFLYGMALTVMCMQIDRYMFPVFAFAVIVWSLDMYHAFKYLVKKVKLRGIQ